MRYIIAALAGLIGSGLGTLVLGLLLIEALSITEAQGGHVMGLVFFWVPLGALLGAVGAVVVSVVRR
jgi:hypothetical protein